MNVHSKIYTTEEFEHFLHLPENRDRLLELIDGEIVEKMPGHIHGILAAWIIAILSNFLVEKGYPLRWLGVETRHEVDRKNSRLPDVHITKVDAISEGKLAQMPDLAVEIKSPDDTYAAMRAKAEYYLRNGTQVVWLVYPEKLEVEQVTKNASGAVVGTVLSGEDALSAGEVLADFTVTVNRVFLVLEN
jgi:Uma2 family endonuclease